MPPTARRSTACRVARSLHRPYACRVPRHRSDPPALQLHGVEKRFGDLRAVDGVSLRIEPGEIFSLLGPNGAGKTTLISCVTGLARPSAGRIEVFGHDVVRDYRRTRRLVGLVPQEINFDPFFTPMESLLIQMGLMGVRRDPARAEELLRTFALWEKRDAYTRHLSGGMKRRLLVAKALVHGPRLLFLDEPTAGVDVELRQDLWCEVRRLRERGTTIVLTTHYLEEAEELADRIGIVHRGRLLLVEERERLMRRHRRGVLRLRVERPLPEVPARLPEGSRLTDVHCLEVPWSRAEDVERAIAQVRAVATICDIQIEQMHLEDIFVRIVRAAERAERRAGDDEEAESADTAPEGP